MTPERRSPPPASTACCCSRCCSSLNSLPGRSSTPTRRARSGANNTYACATRAAASRSRPNSTSTRRATPPAPLAPPVRALQPDPQRVRGRLAQTHPTTRRRGSTHRSDERPRQPDREHLRALRHHHTIRAALRRPHIPASLTLGKPELADERPHHSRRRALAEQRDRPVETNRVLVRECSTLRHRSQAFAPSRPIPARRSRDQAVKLEVRNCVQVALANETASASRPAIERLTPIASRRSSSRPLTRAEARASTPIPPAAMLWTSARDASANAAA
jgi:hypothetical protein